MPTAHTVARCRSRLRENDTGMKLMPNAVLSASPSAQITGDWLLANSRIKWRRVCDMFDVLWTEDYSAH